MKCTEILASLYDEFESRAAQYLIGMCTNTLAARSITYSSWSAAACVVQILYNMADKKKKKKNRKQKHQLS